MNRVALIGRAASAFWESPINSGKEVSVREMQVSRGGRDVGVAHQALDDVEVLSPADEARRIAVTPAVSKVLTGHARRGPGLHDQVM